MSNRMINALSDARINVQPISCFVLTLQYLGRVSRVVMHQAHVTLELSSIEHKFFQPHHFILQHGNISSIIVIRVSARLDI